MLLVVRFLPTLVVEEVHIILLNTAYFYEHSLELHIDRVFRREGKRYWHKKFPQLTTSLF